SMGAVIAFELARRLQACHSLIPEVLFVSGRRAPHVPDDDPPLYNLPKDEFIAELGRINGTPEEVLRDEELMDLMIPVLRADFHVVQTYQYSSNTQLRCPIRAFCGSDDFDENRGRMQEWREQTVSAFALHVLPGDHFFLRTCETRLL